MTVRIIIANASEAKIYETEHLRTGGFKLLETLEHAKSRVKGEDLLVDRPGHFHTSHSARSAYEANDPKIVEAERFACDLAHQTKLAAEKHEYDQLVLVMPAHIHGFFMKHFTSGFSNLQHLSKDYTKLPVEEAEKLIHEQLFQ